MYIDFLDKDTYTIDDINALIDNSAEESLYLDFKDSRAISAQKTTDISNDISAFANSDGGVIVYGVNEDEKHRASSLSYIDTNKYSKEWLDQVISSNIQPRISNIKIYSIPNKNDITQCVYVVKIPRSSKAPHMGAKKIYYKRSNARCTPMEEYEVKDMYFRKTPSRLSVCDVNLRRVGVNNRGVVVYDFMSQIQNISETVETTYKLNLYITGDISYIDYGRYRAEDKIECTELDTNRLKISILGSMPIFPHEAIDMPNVKLIIPERYEKDFRQNIDLEVVLYYTNGSDEKFYSTKTLLRR